MQKDTRAPIDCHTSVRGSIDCPTSIRGSLALLPLWMDTPSSILLPLFKSLNPKYRRRSKHVVVIFTNQQGWQSREAGREGVGVQETKGKLSQCGSLYGKSSVQAHELENEMKQRQQTMLLAWSLKRQKATSSPNTLDEYYSNDEEQLGRTTTESTNGDD